MANTTTGKAYNNTTESCSLIQGQIINLLDAKGPLTRKNLVNQLNIPRTTIYDNLVKLQKRRVVKKFNKNNGKRGRPPVYWKYIGN